MAFPQHSGFFESSAAISTVLPQFSHSYSCMSAIRVPLFLFDTIAKIRIDILAYKVMDLMVAVNFESVL
jgi:hypothetical protein